MLRLCPNCLYIGKPNNFKEGSIFGIIVSLVTVLSLLLLGFWYPVLIIGVYLFLALSLILLFGCLDNSFNCPQCNKNTLIPVNSDKAHEIIASNNLSVDDIPTSSWLDLLLNYDCLKHQNRKICMNCSNIGIGSLEILCEIRMGLLVFITGVISIPLALLHPLALIGASIFIIIGISFMFFCFLDTRLCPKCHHESMISLASTKAKMFAADKNLDFDEPLVVNLPFLKNDNSFFLLFAIWAFVVFFMYKLYCYFNT